MRRWLTCAAVLLAAASGYGQVTIPGADGSDGVLDVTAQTTIDLGLAASGPGIYWDTPSPVAGQGVYDPEMWAVVFKYSSVNIASGKTLKFTNHPSGAPVVWLVSGNVTIAGTIFLDGEDQNRQGRPSLPGPGGFRGGSSWVGTTWGGGGFGPGGAFYRNGGSSRGSGGSYGTAGGYPAGQPAPRYGNAGVLPLIGGSGGSGSHFGGDSVGYGGGAGGGAILIACPGTIALSGTGLIRAYGGQGADGPFYEDSGGGSGGAIRLICNAITMPSGAQLRANYGWGYYSGGDGRIRIEANELTLNGSVSPPASIGYPGEVARLWPDETAPRIGSMWVADQPVPPDPHGKFSFPDQDVTLNTTAPVAITVEAFNVPLDWTMKIRVVPRNGQDVVYTATPQGNSTPELSYWVANAVTIPTGFSAIQARVAAPGAMGVLPPTGEPAAGEFKPAPPAEPAPIP